MIAAAKKQPVKRTREQLNAETRAVEMLNQARQLIEEDDLNVEEARRIRHYVVHEYLPSKKLYILRKDPKSLLLDLDRKIQRASTRLALMRLKPAKKEAKRLDKRINDKMRIRKMRYSQATKQAQEQMLLNALGLLGVFVLVMGAFLAAYNYYGPDLFYQSFTILPNR